MDSRRSSISSANFLQTPEAEGPGQNHSYDGKIGKVDFLKHRIIGKIPGEVLLGLVHLVPDLLKGIIDIHGWQEFDRHR